MLNIVFYFSGTGNSLKVAKTITDELGNCEIISMGKKEKFSLLKKYDTIGFIYPDYFWGLPKRVIEFVRDMNIGENKNTYFYSIATYGGNVGNTIYQLYELLLKNHQIKLNFGSKLKMFSNYVVMYEMKKKIEKITKDSNDKLVPVIDAVKNRKTNKINSMTRILNFLNKWFVKNVSTMDRFYTINDSCTGCSICKDICPVRNIEMQENKPVYKHNCEQCVACIQYCPQKAINYKDSTQKRRRYTHPEISYKELIKYNNMSL